MIEHKLPFCTQTSALRIPRCLVLYVLVLTGPVQAQQDTDSERTAVEMVTPACQSAIDQGLAYLASRQNDHGSFGASGYSRNVAICALSGMAFTSAGSTPGRGPYGRQVNRCVDYLLSNTQDSGFIIYRSAASHGPMYGHGFATLFLSEVYGMAPQAELREKLGKAVNLIVNTQNDEGGWRYHPRRQDADVSVTICQIMALRAARNAGVFVPNETVDRCTEYIKQSQNPEGGFRYQPGTASQFPRSAAGVVALYSAGIYKGDEIDKGLKYLMKFVPHAGAMRGQDFHYFYGQYYAAQAMWHAGGNYWNQWYPAIREELVARQREDGSWQDPISPEYGTAMATLILQLPNNYLPIFQR